MELLVAELADPAFAGGDGHLGKVFLALDHRVDLLLECVLGNETVNHHVFVLADTVGTVGGLSLDGRVPPKIKMNHVRGCGQIKAGSGGLQGKNEYLVLPAVLETGHHLVALLDRAASVIEHRSLARPVTDKLHEHLAHLLELREHQHLLAGVHDPVQPVKKHLHLAGKRRRHIPVLQVLRRMVAYLLQRKNHLKDKALPFEKRDAVGSVLAFDLSHRRIQRLVVQGRLLRRKG